MTKGRFAEEFKEEAVKQVSERGTRSVIWRSDWGFQYKVYKSG